MNQSIYFYELLKGFFLTCTISNAKVPNKNLNSIEQHIDTQRLSCYEHQQTFQVRLVYHDLGSC